MPTELETCKCNCDIKERIKVQGSLGWLGVVFENSPCIHQQRDCGTEGTRTQRSGVHASLWCVLSKMQVTAVLEVIGYPLNWQKHLKVGMILYLFEGHTEWIAPWCRAFHVEVIRLVTAPALGSMREILLQVPCGLIFGLAFIMRCIRAGNV